jgi:hypothetical protein
VSPEPGDLVIIDKVGSITQRRKTKRTRSARAIVGATLQRITSEAAQQRRRRQSPKS